MYFHVLCVLSLVGPISGLTFKGFALSDRFKFSKPTGGSPSQGVQDKLKSGLKEVNASVSDLLQRMTRLETTKGSGGTDVQDEVKLIKDKQDTLSASLAKIESSLKNIEERVDAATGKMEKNMKSFTTESAHLETMIEGIKKPKREVAVNNLALNKPTKSSSIADIGSSSSAVDGSRSVDWWSGSCFKPRYKDHNGWWQVNLGSPYVIKEVNLTLRGDQVPKLQKFDIEVFTDDPTSVNDITPRHCFENTAYRKMKRGAIMRCPCTESVIGQYLRITAKKWKALFSLTFCEVTVSGEPKPDDSD